MVSAELNWLEKITKRASDRYGKYGTRWRALLGESRSVPSRRWDRDDANAMAQRNLQLINLIDRLLYVSSSQAENRPY